MSKLSICIPTYNNVAGLKRLLQSIKQQTYTDYEIIVSDNSDDQSIYDLVKSYPLPIQYSHEPKGNSTANWNSAISKASGEYIKIMHHDDWFTYNDSLEKLVVLLDQNPSAVFAFCGTRQNDLSTLTYHDRFTSDSDLKMIQSDWHNLFIDNVIGAPSATICRRTTSNIFYDTSLKWLVDMDYYMQLLSENAIFVYTNEPLICIGLSSEQITCDCSANSALILNEYIYLYHKYRLGSYCSASADIFSSERISSLPLLKTISIYKRKMLSIIFQYGSFTDCFNAHLFPLYFFIGKLQYKLKS